MKLSLKKSVLLILLLTIFLVGASHIYSQENQLQVNYVLKRDVYFQAYQNYLASKKAYLNKETLERKRLLFKDFKTFLYARNKLMESYLEFLLNRLSSQLPQERLDKLNQWQVWLMESETEINQITKVEDLDKLYLKSGDLDEIYPELEADIFYRLAEYAFAGQQEVIDQIEEIIPRLELLTEDQGWVVEVNNKLRQAKEAREAAMEIIEDTRVRRKGDIRRGWSRAKTYFNQAQDNLDLAIDFTDEVIKRVE